MRFHKPLKLPLLSRVLEVSGKRTLHVAPMLAFPLDAPKALLDEVSFWAAVTPLLGPVGVLDDGVSRGAAEFVVVGSFHAPGGLPTPASFVRVRVGGLEKRIAVLGDRHWQRGVPTQPAPITTLPIDWAHAFGGPSHPQNPYGMGIELVERAGQRVQPLPNIEHFGALLRSPTERPAPAGLGPLDVTFEQRRKRAGTYGRKYVAEGRAGLADDYAPTLFNLALEDQWSKTLWSGAEEFSVENMHPSIPVLRGRLPSLRPRVFVTRAGEGERFEELATRCDAVWLFPDANLGVVLFHGATEVSEPEALDITEMLVGCDELGGERPEEYFRVAWRRRRDPDRSKVAMLSDSDLMPPRESGVAPNVPPVDVGQWTKGEGLMAWNLYRGAVRRHEQALAIAAEQGVDLATLGLTPPVPPAPLPDAEDLDAMADEIQRIDEREKAARTDAEQRVAALEETAREQLAGQGIDLDELREEHALAAEDAGGPPALELLREQRRKMLAEVDPDSDLARQLTDPTQVEAMAAQERDLVALYRSAAQHQPPARLMTEEASQLARVVLDAARESREPLRERDFTGADFRGLDLRDLDLTKSLLECADLRGADLRGATLAGTVLTRTDLRGARLDGAHLRGANLAKAKLEGAVLDGADLREATLSSTSIEGASFVGADLEAADVMEVDWSRVDLSKARFTRVVFLKARLVDCVLAGAHLEQASFVDSEVTGCDFSSAKLHRASFIKTSGERCSFAGATMTELVMVGGGDFSQVDLRHATLHKSCLRGTRLRGARLGGAVGTMVDLSECDLSEAHLDRAELKGALLMKANLRQASLRGCNLLEALFMGAALDGADFTGAQLCRAVLTGAKGDGATRFTDADVEHARFDRASEGA